MGPQPTPTHGYFFYAPGSAPAQGSVQEWRRHVENETEDLADLGECERPDVAEGLTEAAGCDSANVLALY